MYTQDQRHQFVELRAAGHSYSSISAQLGIGKATCISWGKELEADISMLKADQLAALHDAYGMAKAARIKRLGCTLQKLDAALEKVDFTTVDPAKLLEMKLKYAEALKAEYSAAPMAPMKLEGSEDCQKALQDLLHRVQNGEATDQQAARETAIINTVHNTFVTARLKEQLAVLDLINN